MKTGRSHVAQTQARDLSFLYFLLLSKHRLPLAQTNVALCVTVKLDGSG